MDAPWSAARHGLALLLLPGTVLILVPFWIARASGTAMTVPASDAEWVAAIVGLACLGAGAALFVASVRGFVREGKGTLAPWDPPQALVIAGPYAYVRNPMISGVIFLLVGEGLLLRSLPHLTWAALFFAGNAVYIPLLEEPELALRFGEDYKRYRKHVPRFLPRVRPWRPENG